MVGIIYNALQRIIYILDIKVNILPIAWLYAKTKHPNKDPKIYCELHSTECWGLLSNHSGQITLIPKPKWRAFGCWLPLDNPPFPGDQPARALVATTWPQPLICPSWLLSPGYTNSPRPQQSRSPSTVALQHAPRSPPEWRVSLPKKRSGYNGALWIMGFLQGVDSSIRSPNKL